MAELRQQLQYPTVVKLLFVLTSLTAISLVLFFRQIGGGPFTLLRNARTARSVARARGGNVGQGVASRSRIQGCTGEPFSLDPVPHTLAQIFRDYISFHAEARSCYSAARTASQALRCPPALVWTCPVGTDCFGLGDRMFRISLAFFISVLSKRAFFVDWRSDSPPFALHVGLVPRLIDWRPISRWRNLYQRSGIVPSQSANWRDPRRVSVVGVDGRPRLFSILDGNLSAELRHIHVLEVYTKFGSAARDLIISALRKPSFTSDISDIRQIIPSTAHYRQFARLLYSILFKPSPKIERLLQRLSFPANVPYVAVQLRMGLDFHESSLARFSEFRATDMRKFARDIITCARLREPQAAKHIFLASDTASAKQAFLEVAAEMGVQVKSLSRDAVHVSLAPGKRHDVQCQVYLDVFTDVVMLSRAKLLLTTGSLLSFAAHALSDVLEIQQLRPTDASQCK